MGSKHLVYNKVQLPKIAYDQSIKNMKIILLVTENSSECCHIVLRYCTGTKTQTLTFMLPIHVF